MKIEYIDQLITLDVDDFDFELFDLDKKEDGQALGHYHGEYVAIDLDDYELEEFLNASENNQAPHEMGDMHEYIQGGLTYDKDGDFMKFQKKIQAREEKEKEE
tara:strand:+ start:62 stop:370 length:309 start_codon:yes stop_codon:yes gene_type:complete